jgi:hypothetical protein
MTAMAAEIAEAPEAAAAFLRESGGPAATSQGARSRSR